LYSFIYNPYCALFESGQRIGLFDGLNQRQSDSGTTATYQGNTESSSVEPSHTPPLLIPAKHVAVISALTSSPPPDLGLPMASADDGASADNNGPPILEPEMSRATDGLSHDVTAAAATAASDCAVVAASMPSADSENRVITIE